MPDKLSKPTLPTFSWIGHLKQDDRELLSSYGEFFPGHPGNVIIEEGAMQTEVFVVISGKLEVRAQAGGRQRNPAGPDRAGRDPRRNQASSIRARPPPPSRRSNSASFGASPTTT